MGWEHDNVGRTGLWHSLEGILKYLVHALDEDEFQFVLDLLGDLLQVDLAALW